MHLSYSNEEGELMKNKKKLFVAIIEMILFLIIMYPCFDNRLLIALQTLIYCIIGMRAIKNFQIFFEENKKKEQ